MPTLAQVVPHFQWTPQLQALARIARRKVLASAGIDQEPSTEDDW